jgi:hypothetical protein
MFAFRGLFDWSSSSYFWGAALHAAMGGVRDSDRDRVGVDSRWNSGRHLD